MYYNMSNQNLYDDLLKNYPPNGLIQSKQIKLGKDMNILNELNRQMNLLLKESKSDNNFIYLNYNYLFGLLVMTEPKSVNSKIIQKYIGCISKHYHNQKYYNIISHNINKLNELNKLTDIIIFKILNCNKNITYANKINYKTFNDKKYKFICNQNDEYMLGRKIFNKYSKNLIDSGLIKLYENSTNLNHNEIINLFKSYASKNIENNKNDNDILIKILENNNYPKDTKYLKYIINCKIYLNYSLSTYFYPNLFDLDILNYNYILNIDKEDINKLGEKYPNQKMEIMNNLWENNLYCYSNCDKYYIMTTLESLKFLSIDELEKYILLCTKYYDKDCEYFKKYMLNENLKCTNIFEYFIYLGYVPSVCTLMNACKYMTIDVYNVLIEKYEIFPDEKCLEYFLDNKINIDNIKQSSNNNRYYTKSKFSIKNKIKYSKKYIYDFANKILKYDIKIDSNILKKCIDFDLLNKTKIFEIIIKNVSKIDEDIINYAISNKYYIANLDILNGELDENFYYKCFVHCLDTKKYKFVIDSKIIKLRNMFKSDSLKDILEYMNKHNIEPDNYCFVYSILNNDEKLINYMNDKYIAPISCITLLFNNDYLLKKYHNNNNIIKNNSLIKLQNYEKYSDMCKICKLK